MALQSIKSSFQKIKIWQSLTFALCALMSSTTFAQSDFPKQKPITFIVADRKSVV